jgi:hypothetical protein
VKTQLTIDQRQRLRRYISAIGVGKASVLLQILAGIESDRELLTVSVIAAVLDGQTPHQTTEFLTRCGVCQTDIAQVFAAVLASARQAAPHWPHGWN